MKTHTVKIHGSWLVFTILFMWTYNTLTTASSAVTEVKATFSWWGVVAAIFYIFSIVLHEYGHKITSHIFNVQYPNKMIFPFGDVIIKQSFLQMPEPTLIVALSGPIVSLSLAAVAHLLYYIGSNIHWNYSICILFNTLSSLNLFITCLNLLPIKPFDAVVFQYYLDDCTETFFLHILGTISRLFPSFWFLSGTLLIINGHLYSGIWSFLIGGIIMKGLSIPLNPLLLNELQTEHASDYMRSNPITVQSNLSLKEFVANYPHRFNAGIFPVFSSGILCGYINTTKVHLIPEDVWHIFVVGDLTEKITDQNTVTSETEIASVLRLMCETSNNKLLVLEYGNLAGVITWKDLSKYFYKNIFTDLKKHPSHIKDITTFQEIHTT